MEAVIVTKNGDPDVFEIQELPTPSPGPGEVCIRVSKAGINFADILARMGLYPGAPSPPFTPGMEVSGTIHALGPDVEDFAVGDRVLLDMVLMEVIQLIPLQIQKAYSKSPMKLALKSQQHFLQFTLLHI